MAASQTHGLIDLGIFGIFILLSALGLTGKITFWEYVSGIFWGVLIDFDHFISKKGLKYLKDIPDRIFKRGGGGPSEDIGNFPCLFHLLPGFIIVWLWGLAFHHFSHSPFRFWFPFVFWAVHTIIDYLQRSDGKYPHYHILYPFVKKLIYQKKGYPIKSPAEFIVVSTVFLVVVYVLFGLLILR